MGREKKQIGRPAQPFSFHGIEIKERGTLPHATVRQLITRIREIFQGKDESEYAHILQKQNLSLEQVNRLLQVVMHAVTRRNSPLKGETDILDILRSAIGGFRPIRRVSPNDLTPPLLGSAERGNVRIKQQRHQRHITDSGHGKDRK